jgi:5-methylcytosine-specific restriction endonuclease McrA
MRGYHEATGDARRDYMRNRLVTNGERVRELDRNRYERDKEKRIAQACEHVKIRRARLAGVDTDPGVTVPALRKIHGDNCCYCGVVMTFKRGKRGDGIAPNRATLEHVLPISKGGSHTFANTALACHRCNVTKNARTVEEWKKAQGYGWKEAVAPGAA